MRWSGVVSNLIDASEKIVITVRKDVKFKSDNQSDFNDYMKLLLDFFENFIHANKKNQVSEYHLRNTIKHLPLLLL